MTHDTIRALFIEGRDIHETEQYEFMIEAVERATPEFAYGCRSREEVDRYFDDLLSAFDAIQDRGYLTQRDLGGDPGDEIKLYLTRDGRWCHGNGGNHRIRIAELLTMQWVPFIFAGAHPEWIERLSREAGRPARAAIFEWLRQNEKQGLLRRQVDSHAPSAGQPKYREAENVGDA